MCEASYTQVRIFGGNGQTVPAGTPLPGSLMVFTYCAKDHETPFGAKGDARTVGIDNWRVEVCYK